MIKCVIGASKLVSNQRHSIKMLVKHIKSIGLDSTIPKDMLVDIIV